jgi:hypothetical protein
MQELPEIDSQQVRGLALSGATDGEIADFFNCTVQTLLQQFGAVLIQARATRYVSLRKRQTIAAADGNIPMMIFLGKHELGQVERSNHDDGWPQPQMDPKVG